MLENSEEYMMTDATEFGAFAIVLDKSIASSLKTVYATLLNRYEGESKQIRFICVENSEVIYMQSIN